MTTMRFNHMELTFQKGELTAEMRDQIDAFYGDVFGWEGKDVPILKQMGHLLNVDPGQFILLIETNNPIQSPGFDHLGLLMETREEVDETLAKVKAWQEKDDRVLIKEYEDLVQPGLTVHAFYVKYLLPIYFDIQVLERAADAPAATEWKLVTN